MVLVRAAAASTSGVLPAAVAATATAVATTSATSSNGLVPRARQCHTCGQSRRLSSTSLSSSQRWSSASSSSSPPAQRRYFSSTARKEASVKDPYATLGVKRDASAKEIKGKYYELARKYHPDVNKEKDAKEKFVDIQNAYDILSDDKKKSAFDRFGTTDGSQGFNPFGGGGGGAGAAGFDPFGAFGGGGFQGFSGNARDASDIFEGLFGAFGGGGGGQGRASRTGFAGETRGDDLETTLNITFEEACRGTSKSVTIAPVDRCSTCDGAGLNKGAKKRTCGVCNGTGTRTFVIQSGFQMASTCPACGGAGQTVAPGDECRSCEGVGRVRSRKTVEVKIPPGVDDGAKIRMDGQGDVPMQGPGPAGSLYVRIGVRPSKVWRRQGSNLYFPATVPFHTAILGGKVRVPTLDGDVDVRVPAGTQVGDEMLLRGRGVPSLMRRGDKGDLLVQFEVTIPRTLSKRQKEILQQYVDDVEGRTTAPSTPPPQQTQSRSPPPPPPPPAQQDSSSSKASDPSSSRATQGMKETNSTGASSSSTTSSGTPPADPTAAEPKDAAPRSAEEEEGRPMSDGKEKKVGKGKSGKKEKSTNDSRQEHQ